MSFLFRVTCRSDIFAHLLDKNDDRAVVEALSAKIDPDGTLGITPKKITRLVRESVAALRGNGILADTYRSNGKRWISLKRADRADFLPVKTIGTIDPAGVPSTCTVP